MGIWLACDDPWYRDCLVELLRPARVSILVADDASGAPPAEAAVLLANHDPRTFDLFRWLPVLSESGARLPVVALFDAADRERAAAAARSLPVFACLIKPIPNEIVALSVRRALESTRTGVSPVPNDPAPMEPADSGDPRRAVLRAFV